MLVLSCVFCLIAAGRFAWAGGGRMLRLTLALGASNLFATLAVVSLGLVNAGRHVWTAFGSTPADKLVPKVITAAAESVTAGVMGFATLTLVALLLAVGFFRRLPTI